MAKTVKSTVKRQVRRTAKANPAAVAALIVALAESTVNVSQRRKSGRTIRMLLPPSLATYGSICAKWK